MTVRDYSTTANDNTSIEGIALADTMLANALDNAIRQAMADTAELLLDIAAPTATTGSSNAYVLATTGTVTSYADKLRLVIRPNFSNTGACTINVDSLGAIDIKIYTSSGIGNPASGQIQSGGVYDLIYVSALSDFVLLNPAPSASSAISNVVEDTTPQLGGMLDVNGSGIGDGTDEILLFSEASTPVNEITVGNADTGAAPTIAATGDDTNIDLSIAPKGSGTVDITDPDFVLGSDADGDVYYRSGGQLVRLAKGTADQVLTMNSGATAPEWAAGGSEWEYVDDMYDSGVDGTVASIESSAMADGYEYRFVFLDISGPNSTVSFQIEFYRETDATYHASTQNMGAEMSASADDLFGFLEFKDSRQSKNQHEYILGANEDSNASPTTNGIVRYDPTDNFAYVGGMILFTTAQKISKIRGSFTAGNIEDGVIEMWRRPAA